MKNTETPRTNKIGLDDYIDLATRYKLYKKQQQEKGNPNVSQEDFNEYEAPGDERFNTGVFEIF